MEVRLALGTVLRFQIWVSLQLGSLEVKQI